MEDEELSRASLMFNGFTLFFLLVLFRSDYLQRWIQSGLICDDRSDCFIQFSCISVQKSMEGSQHVLKTEEGKGVKGQKQMDSPEEAGLLTGIWSSRPSRMKGHLSTTFSYLLYIIRGLILTTFLRQIDLRKSINRFID